MCWLSLAVFLLFPLIGYGLIGFWGIVIGVALFFVIEALAQIFL